MQQSQEPPLAGGVENRNFGFKKWKKSIKGQSV
jgi:hypothetical protein